MSPSARKNLLNLPCRGLCIRLFARKESNCLSLAPSRSAFSLGVAKNGRPVAFSESKLCFTRVLNHRDPRALKTKMRERELDSRYPARVLRPLAKAWPCHQATWLPCPWSPWARHSRLHRAGAQEMPQDRAR